MHDPRLVRDVARETARHIVDLVEHLLRPEERRDLFVEVFARAQAGIETYLELRAREAERLYRQRPGRN